MVIVSSIHFGSCHSAARGCAQGEKSGLHSQVSRMTMDANLGDQYLMRSLPLEHPGFTRRHSAG